MGGPHDFFETPKWAVDRFLEAWRPPENGGSLIVEPGAGRGMIIRAASPYLPGYGWLAVEIRGEEQQLLEETGAEVVVGDFCDEWLLAPREDVAAVIGNPSYAIAFEVLLRARELYPRAPVAFLLRLGFMASDERADWMRRNRPDLYVLPDRVVFYAGNGDSSDYAWMVWPPLELGERTWGRHMGLASTPEAERSRKWLQKKRRLVPAQADLFLDAPANT